MKAYATMGLLHAGIAVALRAAGGFTPMTSSSSTPSSISSFGEMDTPGEVYRHDDQQVSSRLYPDALWAPARELVK